MNPDSRALRDPDAPTFEEVASLYRRYIQLYGCAPRAYDARFLLAEIYLHRHRSSQQAGPLYLEAARIRPQGQYTQQALYNAGVAFQRVDDVVNMFAAIELYEELFPNGEELPELLQRRTQVCAEPAASATAACGDS